MDESSGAVQKLQSFPIFSQIPPEELARVAEWFEEKTIPEGKDIFREGEPGKYFYLLQTGAVSIWRRRGKEEEQTALLGPGDSFGEEALTGALLRSTTAYTESEAVVLRASAETLRSQLDRLPGVQDAIRAIVRGRRLIWRVRFPWLSPEETVYLATRKAGVLLAPDLVVPVLIALASLAILPAVSYFGWPEWTYLFTPIGLLAAVAAGIWQAIDWSNDYYLLTNRRVVAIRRVPLIYDDRQEAPLGMIQSISVSRSMEQRALGYGDIVIRTFTRPIVFESVPNPKTVANVLEAIWRHNRSRETESDREEIGRILAERLHRNGRETTGSEEPAPLPDQPPSFTRPGEQQAFLGRMQTRFESGDMITYRKHVFFLGRNLFLPGLLILFGINLAAAIAVGVFPVDRLLGVAIGIGASILGVLWGIYEYVDWANDLYQVTAEQILAVHRKPLGDENRRAAALENILNLEYDRPSPLARLLNFGTVKATVGQVNFTFEEVSDPVHVQEDIFRRMEAKRNRREEHQRTQRREEIADWIETYHHITRESEEGEEGQP